MTIMGVTRHSMLGFKIWFKYECHTWNHYQGQGHVARQIIGAWGKSITFTFLKKGIAFKLTPNDLT